ncbi:hypothetical protein QBC39DRAFT_399514 [Podospora conica]|nr:hypothetical protein QBC39DRAFT_399514 [Schizothecium conicum]
MNTIGPPAVSDEDTWVLRLISTAGKRLFWRLNGPLEHAITVSPSEYYDPEAVMEPYFCPAPPGADTAPSWHAVSQESLLNPPASSINVRISCIDDWELLWVDLHRDCYDAVVAGSIWRILGPRPGDKTLDAPMYVLRCCGQDRPWSQDVQLDVVAGAGAFVTIYKYVSAVHPWLIGMRNTLLDALGKLDGKPPWPTETNLAVLYPGPGRLSISRKERAIYSAAKKKEGRFKFLSTRRVFYVFTIHYPIRI